MPKKKIEISMTTFIDFVAASGTSRITVVRDAKKLYGEEYTPAFDYWRILRNAILEMHENGEPKNYLNKVIGSSMQVRKRTNYSNAVKAYKKWMGRKNISWFECPVTHWESGHLDVRVNPELGLSINDNDYLVKLYFRAEQLSKRRIDTMLHLIKRSFEDELDEFTPAILDIQRSKLHVPTIDIEGIEALLIGEAAAFSVMWDHT